MISVTRCQPAGWLVLAAGTLGVLLSVLLLAGCNTDARDTPSDDGTVVRKPVAYHPEAFPDIPFGLLVGYRLSADDRQVAVAIAGGSLRRLSLVFITRPGDEAKDPQAEIDRIGGGLRDQGWQQIASESKLEPRWTKGDETLAVTASLESSATIISFQLIPQ